MLKGGSAATQTAKVTRDAIEMVEIEGLQQKLGQTREDSSGK